MGYVVNKKQIKRRIRKIQNIKTWHLIVLFFLFSMISATFLRLNNISMIERRNAVLAADEEQDAVKIKNKLYELQHYVSSHMNTNMGKGIYLETSYQEAVDNAYDDATSSTTINIYRTAQDICEPKFSYWSEAYVSCVSEELGKFSEGEDLVSKVVKPSPDSYLHVFSSPLWSADLAGWTVLVSVVLFIMIFTRIISVAILKLIIKIKYRNI